MRQVTVEDMLAYIRGSEEDVLFLAAPNFEVRSMAWLPVLRQIHAADPRGELFLAMLALQSQQENAVLEKIKRQNVAGAHSSLADLKKRRFVRRPETLRYPQDFSSRDVARLVSDWLDGLSTPMVICMDVSALPRLVILALLDATSDLVRRGAVSKLYCLYSWAESYPQAGRPSEVGSLRVVDGGLDLSRALRRVGQVVGVLLPGREAYSGRLFLEAAGPGAEITPYLFIGKDDPLIALQTIYANSYLLTSPRSARTNMHCYYSISRGHRMLVDSARRVRAQWTSGLPGYGGRPAYLVAAFGPKPMLVSAYVATSAVRRALGSAVTSSVVLLSAHNYSDTYSIGCRATSLFEVDLADLGDNGGAS